MSPRSDVESSLGLGHGAPEGWKRLRLSVAYCGTPWRGWQSQDGGGGIQDKIEAAIRKATSIQTRIHGSGRTDAGVHAHGQVAHCDVPATVRMSGDAWRDAINACLPLTIRIVQVSDADARFHARFDAIGKIYRYRIWRPRLLSPFEADRAWHIHGPLDLARLQACATAITGTHNFVRLSANRGDMSETQRRATPDKTTRTLRRVEVREVGELVELEFEGDGFLYKMVRMITGTMVHIARGRADLTWFTDLLTHTEGLQSNQTAPAGGLYLMQVLYPPH